MDDLKYEMYVGAQPEDVGRILVTPEGTKAIFFGSVLQSTFEMGAPYAYVGPGNDGDETVGGCTKLTQESLFQVMIEHDLDAIVYPSTTQTAATL